MIELGYNVFFGAIKLLFILFCIGLAFSFLGFMLVHWKGMLALLGTLVGVGAMLLDKARVIDKESLRFSLLVGAGLWPPFVISEAIEESRKKAEREAEQKAHKAELAARIDSLTRRLQVATDTKERAYLDYELHLAQGRLAQMDAPQTTFGPESTPGLVSSRRSPRVWTRLGRSGQYRGAPDPPAQVGSTERAKRHRSRSRVIASARPASSRDSSQCAISSASHR